MSKEEINTLEALKDSASDQVLLEWAAHAAGLTRFWYEGEQGVVTASIVYDDENDCRCAWNALTESGDGANLEASLGINVEWWDAGVVCTKRMPGFTPDLVARIPFADHQGDKQAARRFASVLVAAGYQRSVI